MLSFCVPAYAEHFSIPTENADGSYSFGASTEVEDAGGGEEVIMSGIKKISYGFFGLAAITSLVGFLWQIAKLGIAGDNQVERSKALKGILFSGISLALFGGLTTVLTFIWNVFSSTT